MRMSKETCYFSLVNEMIACLFFFFFFFFIKNSAEGKSIGLLLTSNPEQCMVVHFTVKWILFDHILRCKLNHLFVVCEILIKELSVYTY